jgi:hypothetical protein
MLSGQALVLLAVEQKKKAQHDCPLVTAVSVVLEKPKVIKEQSKSLISIIYTKKDF